MTSCNSHLSPSTIRTAPKDFNDQDPPAKRICSCVPKRKRTVSFQDERITKEAFKEQVMGSTLCTVASKSSDPAYQPAPNDTTTTTACDETPSKSMETPTKMMPVCSEEKPGDSRSSESNGKAKGDPPKVTLTTCLSKTESLPDSTVTTPVHEVRSFSRNLSSGSNDANIDPNGKYTFEQISQHLQVRFSKLLQCESFSDSSTTDDLRFIKRRTNYSPSNTFRLRIADKMDELGIIQLFMRVWECIHSDDVINQEASVSLNNLVQVVSTIWNISDISRSLCEKVSRSGILEQILQDLNNEIFSINNLGDDTRMYYIKGIFGLLHNICRHCRDSREVLRSLGAVEALQRFLGAEDFSEIIQFRVLLILCYLIDESENNVIHADDSHINYIATILKSAVESKGHFSRKFGFSASEILCGLNHLAANDCNKQRILDSGALPLYVALLQPDCSNDEQKNAGRGLWTLAFSEVCKIQISKESKAISSLQWLVANSTDERVRHGARGALWEVSARWRVSNREQEQDNLVSNTQHIMISYQWDSKPTMLKVKDALQASKYKVWMDVMNMSGSTLEAMALAVERAGAVIVCLSQKYKDSPNCRSEAEYSYRLRKRVIPLVLEPNYSPDGWLGIMIGTRLYFDFSREDLFEASMEGLMKELGESGKVTEPVVPPSPARLSCEIVPSGQNDFQSPPIEPEQPDFIFRQSSQISTISAVSTMSSVLGSTHSTVVQIPFCDLNSWLIDHDLYHQREKVNSFSIDLLREMKEVQRECPKFLYKSLQKEFGLPLVDVLKMSRALRRTMFP